MGRSRHPPCPACYDAELCFHWYGDACNSLQYAGCAEAGLYHDCEGKGTDEPVRDLQACFAERIHPHPDPCSLQYINLLSGSYIAESVFAIAGCGSYMVTALNKRNYAAVLGAVILLGVIAALVNLLTDILYTSIDPRLRTEQKRIRKVKAAAKE